jgi:hypothetical protein
MAKELLTDGQAVVGGLFVKHGPSIQRIRETILVSEFTDGGATAGTKTLASVLPKGALVLGGKIIVNAGFAGDTNAVAVIGDGSTADRFNTGTPNVFATAAGGVDIGVPSGVRFLEAECATVKVTVTTGADFTSCKSNGTGSMTVELYYLNTLPA